MMRKISLLLFLLSLFIALNTSGVYAAEEASDFDEHEFIASILAGDASILSINDSFHDVNFTDWYYDEVIDVSQRLIMTGTMVGTNNYFYPNIYVTRAQAVAILARMFGENIVYNDTVPFTDVPASHWAHKYIFWAYHHNIVNGTSSTTFSPDTLVTRQDFAVMIVRYLANTESFTPPAKIATCLYSDDASISAYAYSSVYKLQRAEVFASGANMAFRPHDFITRAETARIVYVTMQLLIDDGTSQTDTDECLVLKFHNVILTGILTSTLTQKYRIYSTDLALSGLKSVYDTSCIGIGPGYLAQQYSTSFKVVNPFHCVINQNIIIGRDFTYYPALIYSPGDEIATSGGAKNTYKVYNVSPGNNYPQTFHISSNVNLSFYEMEGLTGIGATHNIIIF